MQVQDGKGKQISATDLSEVLSALSEELEHPSADAYAHAFQEGAPINVDATTVRYLAPSAIDADPDVQVVFFKTSLNTGWDCPRAETMMSFRNARDDTSIAQLVGRMVRAPLARRITTDEHLNTVALYLPHYARKGLDKVIKRLRADDPTNMPPTDVRDGRETVGLSRANNSAGAFDEPDRLPRNQGQITPVPQGHSRAQRGRRGRHSLSCRQQVHQRFLPSSLFLWAFALRGELSDREVQCRRDLLQRAPLRIRVGAFDPPDRGDGEVRLEREFFLGQAALHAQAAHGLRELLVDRGGLGHVRTLLGAGAHVQADSVT